MTSHHLYASFSRHLKVRRFLLAIALLGVLLALGACGKRPGSVDPPDGSSGTGFPRVYPSPSTDPQS